MSTPTPRQTTDQPGEDLIPQPAEPAAPSRWRVITATIVLSVLAGVAAVGLLRGQGAPPAGGPAGEPEPGPGAVVPDIPPADQPPPAAPRYAPTSEPPPPLGGLVGEDFLTVVRASHLYWEWLYEHPAGVAGTPPADELLASITHPDCSCYNQARLLAHYAERGWWWTGGTIKVRSVELLERPTPNRVRVRIIYDSYEGSQLIDAAGQVHDREPPSPPYVEEQVLIRESPGSPWRVLDVAEQGLLKE